MIDFYYWPTPNGKKVSIMLEECGAPYAVHPVNILKGEQFSPEFLEISPNNKIPAIVDHDAGERALAMFESGAILQYLAEKYEQFMPGDVAGRYQVLQWLNFQVASVGPMFGQCGHFMGYAPEVVPYAIDRYRNETLKLYGVLDKQLASREFLAERYSVADIAVYPWIDVRWLHEIDLAEFPNVERWFLGLQSRPAVSRGMALMKDSEVIGSPSDETRSVFFGEAQRSQQVPDDD